MKDEQIKIKIYDKKGELIKEATAQEFDLTMGQIRKIMELLKIDEKTDTAKFMEAVVDVWDEMTGILAEVFPDVTKEEMDRVKVKELMPVLLKIIKYTMGELMTIPVDKKNE